MEAQPFLERVRKNRELATQQNKVIYLRRDDLNKKSTQIEQGSSKLGYSWYQTHTRVGIEIPYVLKEKSQLKTDFKQQHITISFPLTSGGEFGLELELYGKVVPEGCKAIVHLNRIELQLEKAEKNQSWPVLRTEAKGTEVSQEHIQSYPTSSVKKKDWDKLEKEIAVDIEKHKEEYGEDPLNNFFKEIFKNADEDKRRAMIKSFQTSAGTVLSTDWNEVAKKDYEGKDRPSPPKGQEWISLNKK